MKSTRAIQNRLTGAFIITTFVISTLYGLLVFNAMKYTEDDILNRRLILESQYFFEQYERDQSSAQLPKSKGLDSYLSTSPDLPDWLAAQPLGTRELHEEELHVGVMEIPGSNEKLYLSLSEHESSSLENELSTLFMVLLMVGALITAIGLIIGLLFSKAISKPIILLTEDVESNKRDGNQPFYGGGRHDEVGALSRSFGNLVTRLQSFLEREKQFTRYASHELRTPISLIKNALAVLKLPQQDGDSKTRNLLRIESATIELESLVNTFLTLGREETTKLHDTIDLLEVLNNNLERNKLMIENRRFDIAISVDTPPKSLISNRALVDILIDNIIRNIYTHGGSEARITVHEHSIIFENNTMGDHVCLEKNVKKSYGVEIVNKLAEKCGIKLSSTVKVDNYITVLEF